MSLEGNVVLAYTSDCLLMLDVDLKRQDETVEFAREYTLAQDLGSTQVMLTSDVGQLDLFGKPLKSFCIVFGKYPLDYEEIKWHLKEARRLGMIQRSFLALRKFGYITIRVNAKNNKIPYPKKVYYFHNGDDKGIERFLRHWRMCKDLGTKQERGVSDD